MWKLSHALGLLGLASTSACAPRDGAYPVLSTSKGFKLVINVTDPSNDFNPPVHNNFVTSIHTGAGLAEIGSRPDDGPVFYQNGTNTEFEDGDSNVLTDGGTPPFPSGFQLNRDGDSDLSTGSLNVGPGTPGVGLREKPVSYLLPEHYLACDEPLEYYQGKRFVVIRHSDKSETVPEQCRSVRLLPQCAKLDDLPPDALSSHQYVLDSPCYENVTSIFWENFASAPEED